MSARSEWVSQDTNVVQTFLESYNITNDDKDFIKSADIKEWVKENELYIWQYFVERQVLYQTEVEWVQRFLEPAPFSKFYMQQDNNSPGKVGAWRNN